MIERLHFIFSLSCIGEGNGNPLECSCMENPRDGGAWWAAVYGVTQSRTQLKRISSSSVSRFQCVRWPPGGQWGRRAVLLSGTKPRGPGSHVSTQGTERDTDLGSQCVWTKQI